MNAERWQRAVALFEAALERPVSERAAFLADACGADGGLRADVEAMLRADENAADILQLSASTLAATLDDPAPERNAGPYRLLHEIGRGGMGTVYLAERSDVGMRAAVKLVRGGLAAPERIRRFLHERRLLARLEHPNIARLLDAGVTADGTPWYAMEYVAGEPIDRWCDGQRLDVTRRVELYEKVCGAVAYAHANLIVHRDLKPNNILVGRDGEPKLLDFGIAKLLDASDDEAITRTDVALATPQYAAPEQLRGQPVTTATDVYALGAVLYELLTGRRAYRVTGGSLQDVERVLRSGTITRPSDVVGEAGVTPADEVARIATARRTDAARLRRQLAGELDAIVLRALAPEPERRYGSVDQLRADLRSQRLGLPVVARPDSWSYRTSRFVRRHRAAVAGAAAFLLALAGFAGAVGLEQRATARERDRAEAAAVRAARIADFLGDILSSADPNNAGGRSLVAVEMLDRGMARVESELGDQPELQAELLHRLSRVYVELGRYEESARAAEKSLALRRRLLPPTDSLVVSTLTRLANSLDYVGRAADAITYLDAILQPLRADPKAGAALAEVLATRARLAFRLADYEAARRDYLASMALTVVPGDSDSAAIRTTYNNYGFLLLATGDYVEAERVHRSNVLYRTRTRGELHTETMSSLLNHARALHELGRWPEAIASGRRALALRRRVHEQPHPALAATIWHLARFLTDAGELVEARALLDEAVNMFLATTGPDQYQLVQPLADRARVLTLQGDLASADADLADATSLAQRTFGSEHPVLAEVLTRRAELELRRGAAAVADSLLQQAHAIQLVRLGAEHPHTRRTEAALQARSAARG